MTFRNGLMHGAPIMKEISMPPGVRRYRVGSLHVLSVPGAVLFFDNVVKLPHNFNKKKLEKINADALNNQRLMI